MAAPNLVRGSDELRELTNVTGWHHSLIRGNKKGPSREGPFSWFQFGAYCTITFFVWMLRPSVTVNKYVPRGMSLTDNTVVP